MSFTPWRLSRPAAGTYANPVAYDNNNIFAKILRGELPSVRVYEDEHTVVIMDIMPQADGHALVLPRAPSEDIFDTDRLVVAAVVHTGQKIARAVKKAFRADGVILLQQNGAAAGQSIFHLHLHVIPRYAGRELRSHGGRTADTAVLEEHARRIREALRST
jgi:histidine triad (HIT) family protein